MAWRCNCLLTTLQLVRRTVLKSNLRRYRYPWHCGSSPILRRCEWYFGSFRANNIWLQWIHECFRSLIAGNILNIKLHSNYQTYFVVNVNNIKMFRFWKLLVLHQFLVRVCFCICYSIILKAFMLKNFGNIWCNEFKCKGLRCVCFSIFGEILPVTYSIPILA